jgi:putative transposase
MISQPVRLRLEAFGTAAQGQKYAAIAPLWRRQWDQVIPFFAFPTDEAAIKLLYLVLRRMEKNWKNAQCEWTAAMTHFAIMFGDRFSVE